MAVGSGAGSRRAMDASRRGAGIFLWIRKLQEESGSFNDEMLEFIDIVFGHTDMIGEGEDDTE